MVQSVSYNNSTKNLSYEVVYKDTNDPSKKIIVEEVTESKLAYAANCPITITNNNDDGSEVEGTVLLPKPSSTDPNTIQYTVMITDGSLARYEEGIDAKRVQYRNDVKPDATNIGNTEKAKPADVSLPMKSKAENASSPDTRNKPVALEIHTSEGTVPSSITCGSRDGTSLSASTRTFTPKKSSPRDATSHYQHGNRSVNSHGNHSANNMTLELKTPSWIQRNRSSQLNLFCKSLYFNYMYSLA